MPAPRDAGTWSASAAYAASLASQVPGLNLAAWSAARNDPAFENTITGDEQAATSEGFNGTPSFLIGKTGGRMQKLEYSSLTDPQSFVTAIQSLEKR